MGVYYVTAVALVSGSPKIPDHRVDMAKFFERAHADAHAEALRSPAFYDIRVEERVEATR